MPYLRFRTFIVQDETNQSFSLRITLLPFGQRPIAYAPANEQLRRYTGYLFESQFNGGLSIEFPG